MNYKKYTTFSEYQTDKLKSCTKEAIVGPRGPQGKRGEQGQIGLSGDTGPTGPIGNTGVPGPLVTGTYYETVNKTLTINQDTNEGEIKEIIIKSNFLNLFEEQAYIFISNLESKSLSGSGYAKIVNHDKNNIIYDTTRSTTTTTLQIQALNNLDIYSDAIITLVGPIGPTGDIGEIGPQGPPGPLVTAISNTFITINNGNQGIIDISSNNLNNFGSDVYIYLNTNGNGSGYAKIIDINDNSANILAYNDLILGSLTNISLVGMPGIKGVKGDIGALGTGIIKNVSQYTEMQKGDVKSFTIETNFSEYFGNNLFIYLNTNTDHSGYAKILSVIRNNSNPNILILSIEAYDFLHIVDKTIIIIVGQYVSGGGGSGGGGSGGFSNILVDTNSGVETITIDEDEKLRFIKGNNISFSIDSQANIESIRFDAISELEVDNTNNNIYVKNNYNLLPKDSTQSLGSSSNKWKELFLSNTININNNTIMFDPNGKLIINGKNLSELISSSGQKTLIKYVHKNTSDLCGNIILINDNNLFDIDTYNLSITPVDPSNNIEILFRINYRCSFIHDSKINLQIVKEYDNTNITICDTNLGTNILSEMEDVFIFNYIDKANTDNTITYKLKGKNLRYDEDPVEDDYLPAIMNYPGNSIILKELFNQ